MNNTGYPPSPTVAQIDSQVRLICEYLDPSHEKDLFWYLIHRDREPSAQMTKVQKVALEFLAWRDARDQGGTVFKAQGVKDRYRHDTIPEGTDGEKKAVKARTIADRLRPKLNEYYQSRFGIPPRDVAHLDPLPSEVSAGRAQWIVYIEIPEGKGWKPIIEWRARTISRPIEPAEKSIDFEPVGTNADAMKYLEKHVPLARRIEDTAIRWDAQKMPYTDLSGFKSGLKQSRAEYALITGPMKYKSYMEVLREVYSEKPEKKSLLRCYRLDQAVPFMNFTILYYPKELRRSSEVLYGYGIKEGKNSVESTTVFRTNNPNVVKEYMRLFEALKNHPSSYPVSVHDPDFIDSYENENDVVATFENFGDISLENLIKKESSVKIKVCFTCTHEMARLIKIFQDNSTVIESIQVLLPTRDSKFLELREEALSSDPLSSYPLNDLIDTNISDLKQLVPQIKAVVRQTRRLMPVMFFQIGNIIIFSPFWHGKPVATGPQSIVRANSTTGSSLEKQFDDLWKECGG